MTSKEEEQGAESTASGGDTRQENLVGGGGGKRGAGERRGDEGKGGKISLEDAIQVEIAKDQLQQCFRDAFGCRHVVN